MVKSFYKQHKGISILELLLVLAIAAMITFIGINRYRQQRVQAEIAQVQANVKLIFTALDAYYFSNCNINNTFNPTMQDLFNAGLLSASNLPHSSLLELTSNGTDFTVGANYNNLKISLTNKPIYTLIINAQLNSSLRKSVYFYRNIFQADFLPPNILSLQWQKLPTYDAQSVGSSFWTSTAQLDYYKQQTIGVNSNIGNNVSDNSCGY